MSKTRGYDYKITFHAPTVIKLRKPRSPKFESQVLKDKLKNADVKLTREAEADAAMVTHHIYGVTGIDHAKEQLIAGLPSIRKTAGVNLTKGDIQKAFDSGSIKFDRIGH